MSESKDKGNFLGGLLLGAAAVGAAVLFFTKTKKGKVLVREVKKRFDEVSDDLQGVVGEIEDKKELLGKKLKKIQAEVSSRAEDVRDEVVEGVIGKAEDLGKTAEGVQKKIKKFFVRAGRKLS